MTRNQARSSARRPTAIVLTLGLLLPCMWAGCGGNETDTTPGTSGLPSDSSSISTSSGGTEAVGSATSGTTGGFNAGTTAGIIMTTGSGGTGGGFEDCEADVSMAESVGLDMYIVFDRSGSMALRPPPNDANQDRIRIPDPGGLLGDCPVDLVNAPAQDSKWCLATNALAHFFTAPTLLDVRAALQFMTPANPDNYDICGADPANVHATPAVNYASLPVDATHGLISALELEGPNAETTNTLSGQQLGTRLEAALNGIAMFTAANADPGRKTIGVLITDGDPYNCEEDPDLLARIAADHYSATGIPTFIIGMTGATSANLETIALGGGGPEHGPDYCEAPDTSCHYWSVGGGDPEAFSEVLAAIQDSVVIACEYAIPEPEGGESLNPDLVAVTYNDASGAEPRPVARVPDAASCNPSLGGWYYDNPDAPTSILLCPADCDTVSQAPSGAAIEIRYGCVEQVL